jgi:transcriptional regulator with XRE-family HTH domain
MSYDDPKKLGEQIASLRKAQGLSQYQLAEVSGLPITAIRRCEQSGKIPLDRYLILASVLKASLQIVQQSIPAQRYKTIEDVIRSTHERHGKSPQARKFHKPILGGMFDRMTQA